ncbi:MAG: CHAT domain-containing protein [Planctomycetales bacterium]
MMGTRQESPTPFQLSSERIDSLLASGESPELLIEYFGEEQYRELRELAKKARGKRKKGPRVLILPGIMGSTIGIKKPLLDDTIWIDPVEIIAGKLTRLSLGKPGRQCTALDVVPLFYTRLKWTLKLHGFDADYHFFDWRQSLDDLGEELAERIEGDSANELFLVAHSMGGLVSRAALVRGVAKVKRLVMLGTPNFGSFVPVQVLRGVYQTVKQVAALDMANSMDDLIRDVFSSFPGLYQLLPSPEKFSGVDLFDPQTWSAFEVKPRDELLSSTPAALAALAPPDARFFLVAGVNQPTIVDLTVDSQGEFIYHTSDSGDGTVPLNFAQMPNVPTWFVNESHGGLPLNKKVIQCVEELLERGTSSVLSTTRTASRGGTRAVRHADLAAEKPFEGRRGDAVHEQERRAIVAELMSPGPGQSASIPPGGPGNVGAGGGDDGASPGGGVSSVEGIGELRSVRISRPARFRVDFVLHKGSITDVPARAYVLGMFANVVPSGAAGEIDGLFGGAIADFVSRRMFSAAMGGVFILPRGIAPLQAESVLFVGMGQMDEFVKNPDASQKFVAENVLRTLSRVGIDDFATVLIGGGSGQQARSTLANMVEGFVSAIRDAGRGERVQRIVLCELDDQRFGEMQSEIYSMSRMDLFEDFDVHIYGHPAADRRARLAATAAVTQFRPQSFLHVSQKTDGEQVVCEATLLTSGGKATAITSEKRFASHDRDRLLVSVGDADFDVAAFGTALGKLAFEDKLLGVLERDELKNQHLVIVHDAESSKLPWETLRSGRQVPAVGAGISRKYRLKGNFSVAKWLETRRVKDKLNILLVINPTGDLPGAAREGEILSRVVKENHDIERFTLTGKEATRERLLKEFNSGKYDIVHYAGHAEFNPDAPERSGILCAGQEILSGVDLTTIGNLPALVFFNACESARLRKAAVASVKLQTSVSFAEAFLRGGVANFVGTYWPVGDDSAEAFAKTFYGGIVQGQAIGDALIDGRRAVQKIKSFDWADYIHYGDPDFRIKERGNV